MRKCVLGMLIALAVIGCRKKEDVTVQPPTIEGLFGAMREEIMRDQLDHYPLEVYAVFFEANGDGIPRALTTYPLQMGRYSCAWDAYYYKDGQWQASPRRIFNNEEVYWDPNCYVEANLDEFYILTEEGQEPKFISIHDGERYVGYNKTKSGLTMYREAFHITIDSEGYMKKIPIPELSLMNIDGKSYSRIKLKSPNDKLEPVQAQRFPPKE